MALIIVSSGHVPRDWGENKEAWVFGVGDSIFQGQGRQEGWMVLGQYCFLRMIYWVEE